MCQKSLDFADEMATVEEKPLFLGGFSPPRLGGPAEPGGPPDPQPPLFGVPGGGPPPPPLPPYFGAPNINI